MIRFNILTIFPEMMTPLTESKIVRRAIENKLLDIGCQDLRDYAPDKHKRVDDQPYGGGAGMIMMAEPLVSCIEAVTARAQGTVRRIYLTPKGTPWTQTEAKRLLNYDNLILLCGRYQGVDQRVIDGWIDEEISIGPYVLAGGELAAMVVVETVLRLIPGVLGNDASRSQETFEQELPEYP